MSSDTPTSSPTQKQFPCQQCGAKLDYHPGVAALKCPYCGHENAIPQSEEQIEEVDYRATLTDLASRQESYAPVLLKCQACGAETTLPENLVAAQCAFCGANIVATQHAGTLIKPQALLPFRVTREEAMRAFQRWLHSLWFAPNALKREALAENRFAGIYVPYWTYDANTTSFYRGERGDDYWVTEHYTVRVNGRTEHRTRQVRKTRWTSVSGTVWDQFDDILVLASRSLPQDKAGKLEPWDLGALVPYGDEYLSGFRAESYQVSLAEGFEVAKAVMKEGIEATVRRDIGGDHQRIWSVKTRYDDVTFKHILLPVWLSAYRYRQRVYRFLVNARTGEVQGERPYSAWKIIFFTLAIIAAVLAVAGIVALVQQ